MNKEELNYEKQMNPMYQSFIKILKKYLPKKHINFAIKYTDILFKYKIDGIKLRLRLLKVLYDYDPPMHMDEKEILDKLMNDPFVIDVGKKSTMDLLEEYIKEKGDE